MVKQNSTPDDGADPVTLRHRIRYRFDNLLARGTGAVLIWLGVVTVAALLVSSALLAIFNVTFSGSENGSWAEDVWQSLLRILDPGTMVPDVGWGRRVLALIVTLFGILIAGTLIGIIAAGVEDRIDAMRRGRSAVVESGHTVILGGSSRLPVIIQQLVLANAHRGRNNIVILADRDPTELRHEIDVAVPDLGDTRLVFRSGDPTRRGDLSLVRLDAARGVIVLSDASQPDVAVVHTVLAIAAELDGLGALPVVVKVSEPTTATRLVRACGPTVHPLVTPVAIARTAAFALRQRGLSQVLTELTDFKGCDLQVAELPELVGYRFDETLFRFSNARPLGLFPAGGSIVLAPPGDTTMESGDRLVFIADDRDELTECPPDRPPPRPTSHNAPSELLNERFEEHVLVIGWNDLGSDLLQGWAATAASTSTVEVAFDPALMTTEDIVVPDLGLDVRRTAIGDLASLSMDPQPTSIVVLGYADTGTDEADARTLLTAKELQTRFGSDRTPPRLVVQLLDPAYLDVATLSGPDDFLISEAIGGQFITQLFEQPERRDVLLGLYSDGGPSIRMVSCDRLDLVGEQQVSDIVATTFEAGLLAIGWRHSAVNGGRLVLNPDLSGRVTLDADDELVVVG